MIILRPIEFGLPISVSRNTDIPTFHMKKWFEWKDRGWVHAPDPRNGFPAVWSIKPEDMHSILWWSKNFAPFIHHPRVRELDVYRNMFFATLSEFPEMEPNVAPLKLRLEAIKEIIRIYGPEKVQWRYSPVPRDWSGFEKLANDLRLLGISECYFSFIHSESKIPEWRSVEERSCITKNMAEILQDLGMTLHGCWEDECLMNTSPNCSIAKCVDSEKIDAIFNLTISPHLIVSSCACSMSIDVGNQILCPCGHKCNYCYASE